ncbi:MAG: hypothetical protein SPF70_08685 [Lachnospiraceae bacterium]|nr:hypothetical protein [Lachnospiraceae bacterium]
MKEYRIKFQNNRLLDTDGLNIEKMAENTYRISISNGSYNVRVYDGDLQDEGDVNVYTTLNGEKQFPIWAGDRVIRSQDYQTTVCKGIMDVEFSGKYVCIQGIDISHVIENQVEELKTEVLVDEKKPCIKIHLLKKNPNDMVHLYKKQIGSGKDPEMIRVIGETYIDTDVKFCETYEYWANIADRLGFEGPGSEKITVNVENKLGRKPEIQKLRAVTLDENKTKLTWYCEDAFAYRIYRKTELSNYKPLAEIQGTTYIDDSLTTDRVYTYGVMALSENGSSEIQSVKSQIKAPLRKRQMEKLDRAALAIRTDRGMYITFRLCAYEYENAAFRIYADGKLIATLPKEYATNYLDRKGDINTRYEIKKVIDGKEESRGYVARNLAHNYLDIPLQKPEPYTTPDGMTYEYTANDASVADLDGDGEYEIILKWDCNGKDNSHKGYSGIVYIDAYKLDGTMLWRINLGPNIRCGAHYTQFMVYDFDGDGYAEMVLKTADGTIDAYGNTVGDKMKDYRNKDGFIIEGPEYLSLIDGRTGRILDTVDYDPARGKVEEWGDSWGNRVDRFLACVAYLDGVHPSVVMCRGYYDHGRPTHLTAYDVIEKKLVKRWKFQADSRQNIDYTNQGFHNLAVADVDGDGCDEIIYGACVIDHDGTGLYSTGLGHGDAMHVGKFSKHSKGFDFFGIHEDADCPYGIEARDAGTGKMSFGLYTGKDTTRGLTAKIDPRYEGNQMWAYYGGGLYNYADGTKASGKFPEQINFAIWWDGDLLRELLDHDWYGYETNIGIPKIYKWNWKTEETDIIFSTDHVLSNNGTKGNPCIQASILGDWREDVVFRGKDSTFLRMYTTTEYTRHRLYTFMHDSVYRLGIAWQNTAYNQPPHTGFYIGPDMDKVPVPEQNYVTPREKER